MGPVWDEAGSGELDLGTGYYELEVNEVDEICKNFTQKQLTTADVRAY